AISSPLVSSSGPKGICSVWASGTSSNPSQQGSCRSDPSRASRTRELPVGQLQVRHVDEALVRGAAVLVPVAAPPDLDVQVRGHSLDEPREPREAPSVVAVGGVWGDV